MAVKMERDPVSEKETGHPVLSIFCQMLTDFQNSFTKGLSSKNVIILS